jgi:hypothetical protein
MNLSNKLPAVYPNNQFPSFLPTKLYSSVCLCTPMLGWSLSPQHGVSSGCGWKNDLQLWRLAENIMNKQPRIYNKGWSSSLLGVGLTTPHRKKETCYKNFQRASDLEDENGDLLADSHNILNRWKNYVFQLLNVHNVSDVRHIEVHTAEPLVPGPSRLKFVIAK